MLKVQEFLLSHSLDDLAKKHGVYARFSTQNPRKFTLNYDQIEAKDGDRIAEECRGLVLEAGPGSQFCSTHPGFGPTRILAFPFKRFYNHGQGAAANIDWETATFFEKMDGTLCIVYFDDALGVWSVGTRSVPDADVPFENVTNKTFRMLFEQAAIETYCAGETDVKRFFDMWLDKKCTYMFELCTPENAPNCIKHSDYKIWLLGVRNRETLKEEDILSEEYQTHFIVCPSHKLTFEKMVDFVAEREPTKYEGLVVRDWNFLRIKVKNAAYVAMSKIKDRAVKSPRALLELVLMGKDDDVRPLLQGHFLEALDKLKDKVATFIKVEDFHFNHLRSRAGDDRKAFAIAVQEANGNIPVQMFQFSGKGTTKDWIMSHQNKDNTFPNAFLDNFLKMIGE